MNLSTNFDDWAVMDFFVSMLIVGIGVALLATGLFTSYFGAGKSQKIGFGLLFSGVAIIVIVYALTFDAGLGVADQFSEEEFKQALVSGITALSGVIVGMFVILLHHQCLSSPLENCDIQLEKPLQTLQALTSYGSLVF